MAASAEIMGSRNTEETSKFREIEKLMASDDGTTSVAAPRDLYLGDEGIAARRCAKVQVDPDALPGLFLVRESYRGRKAYA